jgi:hypothetical protein
VHYLQSSAVALLQCREQQWLVRELNDAWPANLYLAQLDLRNKA